MEVKINREIREYTESMFFGLTLRQFIFTVLAAAASIISYFLLRPVIGIEAVSWVCMLTAVPFAVLGFVRYNGLALSAQSLMQRKGFALFMIFSGQEKRHTLTLI